MGIFRVPIEIGSLTQDRFVRLDALVDPGATYTGVARDLLASLGITGDEERTFVLADGRRTSYEIAWARIRIGNRAHPTIVVLGDRGSETLLGAFALEGFGLAVDPANERLVRVPGMLKQIAA